MRRILVADDDRLTIEVLSRTLTPANFAVSIARDGAEALAALEGPDAPPLAILDWNMPKLDGPDVCKAVRAHAARVPMPADEVIPVLDTVIVRPDPVPATA